MKTRELDNEVGRWRMLSCYTANIAGYLAEFSSPAQAGDRLARSARLSVRTDLPDGIGFSHHATPLNRLADGGVGDVLVYRGADEGAEIEAGLRAELDRQGCLLVLAHSAWLPWSMVQPEFDGPHLLLVDGLDRGRWHVTDHFAGLLPTGGEQEPHAGWIGTAVLLDLMRGGAGFTDEQERRNQLVFGFPVRLPAGRSRWLERTTDPAAIAPLTGDWSHEPHEVWTFLGARLREAMTSSSQPSFLDDLWAASQHHRHRCARLLESTLAEPALVEEVAAAWAQLPQTLRFATESALRGRSRPKLIDTTVDHLAEREGALRAALSEHGWADPYSAVSPRSTA
jgi:hypothetical protein